MGKLALLSRRVDLRTAGVQLAYSWLIHKDLGIKNNGAKMTNWVFVKFSIDQSKGV